MRVPEASAVSTSQSYKFVDDEAEFRIPHELLAEMVNWCGTARAWQPSIWCRITGWSGFWRSARFIASDGCRMLRADFPTSMPEGTYRVCTGLDELILVERGEWPAEIEYAKLWDSFPAKGPWSIEPKFFGQLASVEKALIRAHLRESPPKGSAKEKKRQREDANSMFLSWFELGGSMDAMRVRFGSTNVQALIMPRRM